MRWVVWALALALVLPLAAWADTTVAPIKIAMIEGMSGAFANTGEAVFRNLLWAVERVNARGGVKLSANVGGAGPLALTRFDSKGQNEEALSSRKFAIDQGAQFVVQGHSSATVAALIDAINKHNEREPSERVFELFGSGPDHDQ